MSKYRLLQITVKVKEKESDINKKIIKNNYILFFFIFIFLVYYLFLFDCLKIILIFIIYIN